MQAIIGYLPPITASPTQVNVNCKVINRTLSIKKELGFSYIFSEVCQVIYSKILDVMFKLENENKKIFDKIISIQSSVFFVLYLVVLEICNYSRVATNHTCTIFFFSTKFFLCTIHIRYYTTIFLHQISPLYVYFVMHDYLFRTLFQTFSILYKRKKIHNVDRPLTSDSHECF